MTDDRERKATEANFKKSERRWPNITLSAKPNEPKRCV